MELKSSEKKDNIISLISLKFSILDYEKLNKKLLSDLSTTVIDLFHLINAFRKPYNIQDEVTVYLVDNQLQEAETDTCGTFQLYFCKSLFQLLPNSRILDDKNVSKNTISRVLNEMFSLDKPANEPKV